MPAPCGSEFFHLYMASYDFILPHGVLWLITVLRGKSTIWLLLHTESLPLSLLLQMVIYRLFALKYVNWGGDRHYE